MVDIQSSPNIGKLFCKNFKNESKSKVSFFVILIDVIKDKILYYSAMQLPPANTQQFKKALFLSSGVTGLERFL